MQLAAQQKALPARVPLAEERPGQDLVKLSTERKHLTNVLKLLAYQIERNLVNLIRPHYSRTEDEERTLIQTALQSSAALEPTDTNCALHYARSTLPIDHKQWRLFARPSNKTETRFPCTDLRMRFGAAGCPS